MTFIVQRRDSRKRDNFWSTSFNPGAILIAHAILLPLKLCDTYIEHGMEVQVFSTALPGVMYNKRTPMSVMGLDQQVFQLKQEYYPYTQ